MPSERIRRPHDDSILRGWSLIVLSTFGPIGCALFAGCAAPAERPVRVRSTHFVESAWGILDLVIAVDLETGEFCGRAAERELDRWFVVRFRLSESERAKLAAPLIKTPLPGESVRADGSGDALAFDVQFSRGRRRWTGTRMVHAGLRLHVLTLKRLLWGGFAREGARIEVRPLGRVGRASMLRQAQLPACIPAGWEAELTPATEEQLAPFR